MHRFIFYDAKIKRCAGKTGENVEQLVCSNDICSSFHHQGLWEKVALGAIGQLHVYLLKCSDETCEKVHANSGENPTVPFIMFFVTDIKSRFFIRE